MQLKRVLALVAGALVAGGSLAACSTTPTGSPSSSAPTTTTKAPATTSAPSTTSTSIASSTTTTSTAAPTTTTSSPAGLAACKRSQLSVKAGTSQGAAGTAEVGFTIADTSSTACGIDGYATIRLRGPAGPVVPQVSHKGQGAIFLDQPSTVTLPSGGPAAAAFVVSYSDQQQNGQTSCPEVIAIKITLPGTARPFVMHRDRFFPCGAPNIAVSAIVSRSRYEAQFVG